MHKGTCKQDSLSLLTSATPCLSEYFHMQKELQALRCGDSSSGSYTTFSDGGGLAAQHLVTTQASLKSCLSREMEEGLHIKTKTYIFLCPVLTRKQRHITRRRGINYG